MYVWMLVGSVVLAVTCLVLAPSAAHADPVAECQAITSNQIETGQCLQDTLSTVESVMSRALQRAQTKADSIDQVTGRPGAREALDQSQLTWAQFRTTDCQVPGALAAGGSGSGQFVTGCQIDLTRARTRELDALAGDP
jgi:uncharacterized protein YecT (DUF1311 family)